MRSAIILFIFLASFNVFSQREAANWYFGQNAGLDFNSGQPLPNLDGQINSVEGSATISDRDGNLLFNTDGTTIWNSAHEVMPNGQGIKGSSSSTQTAIIVPNPMDNNIYYVFTTDDVLLGDTGGFNGFNYSIIDMSLDNGRGDVLNKNVSLLPIGSEKVSGILNFNENYYWVTTHFEDRFYSYKVDENGVDPSPIISIVGPSIIDFKNGRGSLKFSPDGTKLAMSYLITEPGYASSLFVFDFDSTTGIVSNTTEITTSNRAYYGLEFSSNSKKLYASGVNYFKNNSLGNIQIVQFDLESPDFFSDEAIVLDFQNESKFFVSGTLQMGVDKKIYHSIPNRGLSIIREPNNKAAWTNPDKFVIDLGGKESRFGLPQYVQSFFETIFTLENYCLGDTTTFTLEDSTDIVNVSWNYGDPDSGTLNYSNHIIGEHIFTSTGNYEVIVDVGYNNGTTRRFIEYVAIKEIPNVLSRVELVQCDIDGIDDGITSFNLEETIPLFDRGNKELDILFFESEANAILGQDELVPFAYRNSVMNEIVYAKVSEGSECFSLVEITLTAQPMSDLGLYDTLYICDGSLTDGTQVVDLSRVVEQLSEDFQDTIISLYTQEEDALLKSNQLQQQNYSFDSANNPELFFRIEEDNGCAFIGKVDLVILESPNYDAAKTVRLCDGLTTLTAPNAFDTYLWNLGMTEQEIIVDEPGIYDVVFATGTCAYVQTFEVLQELKVPIEKIVIDDFNRQNSVRIELGASELFDQTLFSLDNGLTFQHQNTFSNVLPGIYDLVVDNGCSSYEEQLLVGGVPSFFTPNGDNVNDRWIMLNPTYFLGFEVSIFDRYGQMVFWFDDTSQGWDGNVNNLEMPANDYWYYLKTDDGRTFKGFFTLKR